MHSIITLEVSRVLANPPSSIMNPACMKKTRKAVTQTHAVLSGLTMSSPFSGGGVASTEAPACVPMNHRVR